MKCWRKNCTFKGPTVLEKINEGSKIEENTWMFVGQSLYLRLLERIQNHLILNQNGKGSQRENYLTIASYPSFIYSNFREEKLEGDTKTFRAALLRLISFIGIEINLDLDG